MTGDTLELTDAMHRLTQPWVMIVKLDGKYVPQDFPPLLDMLESLITPDRGRTMGGVNDPAARSVIDVKALDLMGVIRDVTGAWLNDWGVAGTRDAKTDLRAFYARLNVLWRTAGITESDYLNLSEYPTRWAQQIWDLIEPPLQVALRGTACPACGRHKWVNDADEWVDNILVSYRDGGTIQAECRWRNCAALWSGPRELRELGFSIGAQQDHEALREMGFDTT